MTLFPDFNPGVPATDSPLPKIWALLAGEDPGSCAQALALLDVLADDDLWHAIAAGTRFSETGIHFRAKSGIATHVHPDHQLRVAVYALGSLNALPSEVDLINLRTDDLNFMRHARGVRSLRLGNSDLVDVSGIAGTQLVSASLSVREGVTGLDALGRLEDLEDLTLCGQGLSDLSWITSLPKLRRLTVRDSVVKDLAPLARLEALEHLDLVDACVEDLAPLAGLQRLRTLDLSGTHLRSVAPLRGLDLHSVDIAGTLVDDLEPLAGCTNLRELDADRTPITSLLPLRGLGDLERLGIKDCSDLSSLEGVEALRKLRWLDVQYAPLLTDLRPLTGLPALEHLHISRCPRVTDFSVLAAMTYLPSLSIAACPQLDDLRWISALVELRSVGITHAPAVTDVSPLARLPKLERLNLDGMTGAADLSPLAALRFSFLSVVGCPGAERYAEPMWRGEATHFFASYMAARATSAAKASLDGGQRRTLAAIRKGLAADDWSSVRQAIHLASDLQDRSVWAILCAGLSCDGDVSYADGCEVHKRVRPELRLAATMEVLARDGRLAQTQQIAARRLPVDTSDCLTGLSSVRVLHYSHNRALTSLGALSGLDALEELDVSCCRALVDLGAVATMPNLRQLNLDGCERVRDLTPLAGLPRLEHLQLSYLRDLVDIRPLANLPSLRVLRLESCQNVQDFTPLHALVRLRELRVQGISTAAAHALERALPACTIVT